MESRYQKQISGPLLDRIDIRLDVPCIPHEQLADRRPGEPSSAIQERVERARDIQTKRFAGTAMLTNADMGPRELRQYAVLEDAGETLLDAAVRQIGLSARAYHRVLKLGRTIAETHEYRTLINTLMPMHIGGRWRTRGSRFPVNSNPVRWSPTEVDTPHGTGNRGYVVSL